MIVIGTVYVLVCSSLSLEFIDKVGWPNTIQAISKLIIDFILIAVRVLLNAKL